MCQRWKINLNGIKVNTILVNMPVDSLIRAPK